MAGWDWRSAVSVRQTTTEIHLAQAADGLLKYEWTNLQPHVPPRVWLGVQSGGRGWCAPGPLRFLPDAWLPRLRRSSPSRADQSCARPEFRHTFHRTPFSPGPRALRGWTLCYWR